MKPLAFIFEQPSYQRASSRENLSSGFANSRTQTSLLSYNDGQDWCYFAYIYRRVSYFKFQRVRIIKALIRLRDCVFVIRIEQNHGFSRQCSEVPEEL